MIGLVLVSHSAALAEGVKALAEQMTGGQVAIAAAGGVDDPENPIGTDPMRVVEALQQVYSDDGVMVLMDLGSALMSAEMAVEFLEPEQQPNVRLCEAPFVEGAVAAAVQAGAGSSLDEVLEAARSALSAKQQHLGVEEDRQPTQTSQPTHSADAQQLTITIPNELGLHARPAARLVRLTGQHSATLTVERDGHAVSARNINQVALLDARHGDELTFYAEGTDAAALLQSVQSLVDDNFGDKVNGAHSSPQTTDDAPDGLPDGVLAGIGASGGLAIGKTFLLTQQTPDLPTHTVEDTEAEVARFQRALKAASDELAALAKKSEKRMGADEAGIFQAHQLILQDETLSGQTETRIQEEAQPAEAAWWHVIQQTADQYRAARSETLQGRAVDVLDVGRRVLRRLNPAESHTLQVPQDSVLVAPDLTPSDTAQLDPVHVKAVITQQGGATSHTAVIARGLGLPAVVGVRGYAHIEGGQQIIVDGDAGRVYLSPTTEQMEEARQKIQQQREERERLRQQSQQPAQTTDGRRVEVAANIGNPAQTANLLATGAEGVGLFRTELLFMDRPEAPDEDTQAEAYTVAAQNMDGKPVIIRTLDVGGDKPIGYIDFAPEENPFLGHRGIRYWLTNPALARTQLRAICRASAAGDVRVMFPMISTLEELQAARKLLADVQAELDAEGIAHDAEMQVGIMIEVPAAVLIAETLAPHVDFFSIGTNDLTQYIMAADRGNAQVNVLASPFQPAVLRAIRQVVEAAHAHDTWVGMCGEMAGNPTATRLLLGLGLDELSMSAPAIPQVKATIRETDYADAQALAAEVLKLEKVEVVEARLKQM